jgi:hypothetical protein
MTMEFREVRQIGSDLRLRLTLGRTEADEGD